ncbi:DUF3108 domain-containing protein [Bacteroidota bacterium]
MKKLNKVILSSIFTAIAFICFCTIILFSEEPIEKNNEELDFRYIPNEAYGFGEKLEYKVGYKFITAGTGFFHIRPKPLTMKGRTCYDVRFQVRSLSSLEWLYKVRDTYRTVVDVHGIFPWHFEQHIREGNYKRDFKASFDQVNNYATTEYKGKKKKYKVAPYIHDIVSAFFYVRTLDLGSMPKDTIFYLKNFFKDTTYSLGVKVLGKQIVEVEAGKFRCVLVEPLVVEGGLFKSEGHIYIWLTDDDRKIPVKVGTKILIGFVGAELTKYSGIRGSIDAKIE